MTQLVILESYLGSGMNNNNSLSMKPLKELSSGEKNVRQ